MPPPSLGPQNILLSSCLHCTDDSVPQNTPPSQPSSMPDPRRATDRIHGKQISSGQNRVLSTASQQRSTLANAAKTFNNQSSIVNREGLSPVSHHFLEFPFALPPIPTYNNTATLRAVCFVRRVRDRPAHGRGDPQTGMLCAGQCSSNGTVTVNETAFWRPMDVRENTADALISLLGC